LERYDAMLTAIACQEVDETVVVAQEQRRAPAIEIESCSIERQWAGYFTPIFKEPVPAL
jgi:hypothetical protein